MFKHLSIQEETMKFFALNTCFKINRVVDLSYKIYLDQIIKKNLYNETSLMTNFDVGLTKTGLKV